MANDSGHLLQFLKQHKDALTLILTVVAGVWALVLFYQEQHKDRVRVSLSYIEQYRSTDLMNLNIATSEPWLRMDGLNAILSNDYYIVEEHNMRLMEEQHLEGAIYHLFYFYVDIALCAESGLCDRKTLCTFFKTEINTFINWNYPYLTRFYQAWNAPFFEIREFVNSCP